MIRPFERSDLGAVASLYEFVSRSGSRTPPPGLADYFAETFFDQPWADPELPSLVNEERDGSITGFIGVHSRRLVFDSNPIRLACGGELVADPAARSHAPGFFLLQEFLKGAQDLSLTDTAGGATRQMWMRLGGTQWDLASITWIKFFRPVRLALDRLSFRDTSGRLTRVERPLGAGLDALSAVRPRRTSTNRLEQLTPGALVRELPAIASAARLRPAYDERYSEWLFSAMAAVQTRGSLIARMLRCEDGKARGWFIYYLRRGGLSEVVQLVAERPWLRTVLDAAIEHARRSLSAGLRGRIEPGMLEALPGRGCFLRYEGGALIHARDGELLRAISAGEGLLTRMDGEWWTAHGLEPFR
jgi:hypothetical protein